MAEERRYPILLAFLHQSLTDMIEEAVDLFDRNLAEAYSRAGRELDEFRKSIATGLWPFFSEDRDKGDYDVS